MAPAYCHRADTPRHARDCHTFDAAGWLAAWSDNGGIAIRTDERVFVGRGPALDREAATALDRLRPQLYRPGAADALSDYLLRRSHGEVDA